MRLSSSFDGRSNGDSAPLTLDLENFDAVELPPAGIRLEGGVRTCFDGITTTDLDDFGVSMLSRPKSCILLLLGGVHGLGFRSVFGLGGVS